MRRLLTILFLLPCFVFSQQSIEVCTENEAYLQDYWVADGDNQYFWNVEGGIIESNNGNMITVNWLNVPYEQYEEEVIYDIESYDTTTVRASVGNWLVAKYVKLWSNAKVVFNGDGSDEQSGYIYLANAPSSKAFKDDCVRLLKEISYFDVLRSDRSISSKWSLESRTPFLDKDPKEWVVFFVAKKDTLEDRDKLTETTPSFNFRKHLLM